MIERRSDTVVTAAPSRSVAEVLQDTAALTENVVRGEIRLAVVRVQDQLLAQAKRVVLLAVSGVLGVLAFVALMVTVIVRLSYQVDVWIATLIAGLLAAVSAALFFFLSRSDGAGS